MKTNYFIAGDAIEELKKLPDGSVGLICTDPPYNLGKDYGNNIDWKQWHEYEKFTLEWLTESKRILKNDGSIYVFMGVKFISRLFLMLQELGFHFNGWITWHTHKVWGAKKVSLRDMKMFYTLQNQTILHSILMILEYPKNITEKEII